MLHKGRLSSQSPGRKQMVCSSGITDCVSLEEQEHEAISSPRLEGARGESGY